MINEFSTDNLQVGDKVIVICAGWNIKAEYIGEIIKKTPTGLVDVRYKGDKVKRFKKTGYSYTKTEYFLDGSIRIVEYTDERADYIIKRNKRNKILNFLKECEWNTYEDVELERIYNFVNGLRGINL